MKNTTRIFLLVFLVGLYSAALAVAPGVSADRDDRPAVEIAHLLDFINSSDCIFYRNGRAYEAGQAREHIERKYRHIQERVKSAEIFIERAASRSSVSGQEYMVNCAGKRMSSKAWLLQELADFRVGHSSR